MKALVILCLSCLCAIDAQACSAPPFGATSTARDLVYYSKWIVLARVEGRHGDDGSAPIEFDFQTLEVINGRAPNKFKFYGGSARQNPNPVGDFDGHTSPEFWAGTSGNSGMTTMCQIYGLFEIGETYLLISTKEGHFKAYENIRSPDDLWLKVIRLLVEEMKSSADGA